jgi:hypothetical protein
MTRTRKAGAGALAAAALAGPAVVGTGGPAGAVDGEIGSVSVTRSITVGPAYWGKSVSMAFTVPLAAPDDEVEDVSVRLERPSSAGGTYTLASVRRRGCHGQVTCTYGDSAVRIKVTAYLSNAEYDLARLHPGTYRPVLSVLTAARPDYLTARPAIDVAVRRESYLWVDLEPADARKGTVSALRGNLSASWPCGSSVQPCFSDKGLSGATVGLWFDPKGDAGPRRVTTATTDSLGRFTRKVTLSASGNWYARYAGGSLGSATTSLKVPVIAR